MDLVSMLIEGPSIAAAQLENSNWQEACILINLECNVGGSSATFWGVQCYQHSRLVSPCGG